MTRFGMGRSWAYARLSRLVRDGLLEQKQLLYRRPGLYVASAEGLRWTLLGRLGVYRLGPGGFQHAWEVPAAAVALHRALPDWRQLSEREVRVGENEGGELIASASLGELPGGRSALHRPDLVLLAHDRVLAIEVELSIKAPRRLQAICRGYARARHVDHVYCLATPPAGRGGQRACGGASVLAIAAWLYTRSNREQGSTRSKARSARSLKPPIFDSPSPLESLGGPQLLASVTGQPILTLSESTTGRAPGPDPILSADKRLAAAVQ
jgi:hypothetical protein